MQFITISTNQAGQRFDKLLHKCLPEAPGSLIYKMLRKKNITLNDKKALGNEILQQGDEVRMYFSQDTYDKFAGAFTASLKTEGQDSISSYHEAYQVLQGIHIIYESPHVLILNKPAGILTQKASASDHSLNEWMIGYLLENRTLLPAELSTFRPSVCNRLDRNTSGLVLCGKTLAGSQEISRILREGTIRKFYHTIVSGVLTETCLLDGYLIKDRKNNRVYIHKQPIPSGEGSHIRTIYRPIHSNRGITYLEVELLTGKSHQIRAHLSSIGHPVIGDYKYGREAFHGRKNESFRSPHAVSGQLLHAYRLEFPVLEGVLEDLSGQKITAPLPELFQNTLKNYSLGKD